MARFGKLPIAVPQGASLEVSEGAVKIKGLKGELVKKLPKGIKIVQAEGSVSVELVGKDKQSLANQGTIRSHIINMFKGVTTGWEKNLELVGTGFRAELKGKDLILTVGYSHPVDISAPNGVTFLIEKSVIKVQGNDLEVVSQVAAKIRRVRPPDAYQGKGIKYQDEILKKKPGKQAAKSTTA